MIVLGQGDDEPLGSKLESTAPGNLDVGTLVLGQQFAIVVEDDHVESIAVRVAHQDFTTTGNVDAIGEGCQAFHANLAQVHTTFVEHHHGVALEIANIIVVLVDGNVARLAHVVTAIVPLSQLAVLANHVDGGRYRVDGHDLAVLIDSNTGDNVDVADGYFAHEIASSSEDLHSRPFHAAVTDNIVRILQRTTNVGRTNHGNLKREPVSLTTSTLRQTLTFLGYHS